jgi:asparaginyl-tRNA synthetase
LDHNDHNEHNEHNELSTGYSISISGKLVKSPAKGQDYELYVNSLDSLKIYGKVTDDYPLSKSKLPLDYLRKYAHLRGKTSSFSSIFRIRSSISHATHSFFHSRHFFHLNPNIITINECEGGAGVFQLTEKDLSTCSFDQKEQKEQKWNWENDHFGKPPYLTVSSQLQLEALALSMGSVYTTNKSFRSEHSSTHKHLSEFEHLEIEDIFITLDDLMQIGEDYIKFVASYLLKECMDDISTLGKFVSKGLLERIQEIEKATFVRLSYKDAIRLLQEGGKNAQYGDDLSSEFENYLTSHFNSPVFVTHWPSIIKSFYMKQGKDEDNREICENFDLLMPYHIGELIGGSMREDQYDVICKVMDERGVKKEPLSFYLDLRKFGSVPHGGFGLGFDRLCMMFTGMENIKDVVPFPVYYKHCEY